ncbi:hypothetical protein C6A85_08540, partial [Mycobacterium sp. ITM-2017-0098]
VARELEARSAETEDIVLPSRNHAIVLVSNVHLPTLRALAYASARRVGRCTLDTSTMAWLRLGSTMSSVSADLASSSRAT